MQFPLHITFRDIPSSLAIENHIRKKVEKLSHFCDRIITFNVVLKLPQKHRHQGKVYNIRIDISVPKEEIVINHAKNEDVYVTIRDAFSAATRKLQDYSRKQHGHVKTHEPIRRGRVIRLVPEEDYGFIQSFDGTELYFHRVHVVSPSFDQLSIGTEVQFLEVVAGEGFQANRVSAIIRH